MSHCPMVDTAYYTLSFNFYRLVDLQQHCKKRKGRKMGVASKCGCGRSPKGNCIGWHSLSDSEYQLKKASYEKRQTEKAKK